MAHKLQDIPEFYFCLRCKRGFGVLQPVENVTGTKCFYPDCTALRESSVAWKSVRVIYPEFPEQPETAVVYQVAPSRLFGMLRPAPRDNLLTDGSGEVIPNQVDL